LIDTPPGNFDIIGACYAWALSQMKLPPTANKMATFEAEASRPNKSGMTQIHPTEPIRPALANGRKEA
jgi:hypothetical protein